MVSMTCSLRLHLIALAGVAASASAPASAASPQLTSTLATSDWQICRSLPGAAERLACFDQWAAQVSPPAAGESAPAQTTGPVPLAPIDSAGSEPAAAPDPRTVLPAAEGCQSRQYSATSRFWELESGTDCGVLGIRGYRPLSVSVIASNSVNTQPSSPSAGHSAPQALPYQSAETRLQLSLRTKLAQGLLTQGDPTRRDSLWFTYTQQSYWQLFNPTLSRPFRNTDHEPELIYIYPTAATLPWGWRWRYTGLGLVHQSNGQSLPLSRSWNRVYAMLGAEWQDAWKVQAKFWRRLPERLADDDNPDISDHIGRAELSASWTPDAFNTWGLTWRHSLHPTANGSVRLEWLKALGHDSSSKSALRLHTQLFTGFGDSLVDYNRRRTVLSVGLSLVDF